MGWNNPKFSPLQFHWWWSELQGVVFETHILNLQRKCLFPYLWDAMVSLSFSFQDWIDLRTIPSSPSFCAYSPRIEFLCDDPVTKPLCIVHMRDEFVNADLSNLIGLMVSEVVGLCFDCESKVRSNSIWNYPLQTYSTVTDFARFLGWSTSVPLIMATW